MIGKSDREGRSSLCLLGVKNVDLVLFELSVFKMSS